MPLTPFDVRTRICDLTAETTVRHLANGSGIKCEWRLVIDLELSAKQPLTLGKTPFGIIGVRMAKTIGVHDGGGRILNSSGGVN